MNKFLIILIWGYCNCIYPQNNLFAQPGAKPLVPFKESAVLNSTSITDTNQGFFNVSTDSNYRNGYFYLTIGLADLLGAGFGFQINEIYSVGIKWGGYWISSVGLNHGGGISFSSGSGFGIKVSRALSYKVFNNLNGEVMLFYHTSSDKELNTLIKGAAYEINIGHENKIKRGFNFIWSLGIVASCAKDVPPLFMPNLKIGLNINF